MVDWYLPGPSTPAEGVPALRAFAARDCYLPGPSTPTLFRRPYPIVRPLRIRKAVRGYREQERRDKADTASVQAARRRVRVELLGTIALHWKPYRLDKFEWDYHRIPLTHKASVEHRGLPRDGRSWRIRSALA
jgi:hypothetical protein